MAGAVCVAVDDVDDVELVEVVAALAVPRKLAPRAPPVMLARPTAPATAIFRMGVMSVVPSVRARTAQAAHRLKCRPAPLIRVALDFPQTLTPRRRRRVLGATMGRPGALTMARGRAGEPSKDSPTRLGRLVQGRLHMLRLRQIHRLR